MGKVIDLTGQRFGRWMVIGISHIDIHGTKWKCRCACGSFRNVDSSSLRSGRSKSCGCECIPNMIGYISGRLKVIGRVESKNGYSMWKCLCDCGKHCIVSGSNLRTGHKKSCGCLRPTWYDLTGVRFGRLTVIEYIGNRRWRCMCECGSCTEVIAQNLMRKKTVSCGCFIREWASNKFATHRGTNTSEYRAWIGMKTRCTNQNNHNYERYGGRGIKVCDRWLDSFENFYTDMGPKPSPKHSLDRIDPNGDYCPENCQWADWKTQSKNRRNMLDMWEVKDNGVSVKVPVVLAKYAITRTKFLNAFYANEFNAQNAFDAIMAERMDVAAE